MPASTTLDPIEPKPTTRNFLGLKNQSPTEVMLSRIAVVAQFAMVWLFVVEGLKPVIGDWHVMVRYLAAFAIVAATFRYKYNLYGQATFPTLFAVAAALIVSPVMFFDGLGLYWSTGYTEQVERDRGHLLAELQDFHQSASLEIGSARSQVQMTYTDAMRKAQDQKAIDLQAAEARTASAKVATNGDVTDPKFVRATENEKTDKVRAESDAETAKSAAEAIMAPAIEHLDEAERLLAKLVDEAQAEAEDGEMPPVAAEIAEAEMFSDLRTASRHAGALMGKVQTEFSAAGIPPKKPLPSPDLAVSEGNIFEIFVLAIFEGDVTAIICLLVSMLFEMDILVMWLIRRNDKEPEEVPAAP